MTGCVHTQDSLVFSVERSGATATIRLKGVSDARHPAHFLGPLIDEWVDQLKDCEVTVDLRQLEYMNSATVMPIINMVKRLDGNGMPVRVVFLDVDWQRIHGNCMSAIARTLKNVRVERQPFAEQDLTPNVEDVSARADPKSDST
jgi:anti-anti-sigma factor